MKYYNQSSEKIIKKFQIIIGGDTGLEKIQNSLMDSFSNFEHQKTSIFSFNYAKKSTLVRRTVSRFIF